MKSFFTATILGAILALGNGEFVENDSSRRQLAGTIVPRSFIAQVKPEACNSVRARIDELKVSIDGPDAAAREAQARDISYQSDLCFVTFHGGETLKSVVEELPEVDFVEHDTFVQTQVTWGLDRIDQTSLPLDGVNFRGAPDGSGVTVYVIDTGVLSTHPQFQGRATLAFDAVGENGLDGNGHGTHCAGTVGSRDYGVATGATIKGVKVLSAGGSGSNAGVLEGINWSVRDSGSSAAVLSMSLGGGRSTAIDNAVRNAANNGNIVVVAAGNDNSNACNYSPAGAGGNGPSGGVITVGSTTSSDGRSSFSNYGTCVDIFAPGSSITSTWNNGGTRTISGTSMACPHVAGVAAVLLQKNCGNKNAAISELFSLATSNKISDVRGSPNLLLQASLTSGSGCGGGGQPSPTPRPTPTPPTPRPTERSPWTCPNSWFGTGDGCDCECGGGDPDCSRTYTRLYCRGRPASQNQVCDFASDTCVFIRSFSTEDLAASGRTTDAFEAKALEAAAEEPASNSFVVPLAIGCSAFAVVAVGAALFIRRRRASESTVATAQEPNSKPVVSASNPVFDTSY